MQVHWEHSWIWEIKEIGVDLDTIQEVTNPKPNFHT
jgi:hypothetical protein